MNGPPDTEAIEARRGEFLEQLETAGSEVLAAYRSSLEKRTGELSSAADKQKGEVHGSTKRQRAAIHRHFPEDPDKGAVKSLPTKDWATTTAQQVDVEAGRFTQEATTENQGFVDALNEQLSTARDTVRDWGRPPGGPALLVGAADRHDSRLGQAGGGQQRGLGTPASRDSREAMAGDLDALTQLRKAQLGKSKDEVNTALAGLDDEQKVLALKYLRGQGVDSIGFVAKSTMLRIIHPPAGRADRQPPRRGATGLGLGAARHPGPGDQPGVPARRDRHEGEGLDRRRRHV